MLSDEEVLRLLGHMAWDDKEELVDPTVGLIDGSATPTTLRSESNLPEGFAVNPFEEGDDSCFVESAESLMVKQREISIAEGLGDGDLGGVAIGISGDAAIALSSSLLEIWIKDVSTDSELASLAAADSKEIS